MAKKLIALVAVHLLVEGQRMVVAPGEPVPALAPHDEKELLASGAIEDQEQAEADAKAQATAAKKAMGDFQAARKRVQAEVESTAKVDAQKPA